MVRFDHSAEVADALASLSAVAQEALVDRIEDIVRDPEHRNCLGAVGYKMRWLRYRGFHVGFVIDESSPDVERAFALVVRMKAA